MGILRSCMHVGFSRVFACVYFHGIDAVTPFHGLASTLCMATGHAGSSKNVAMIIMAPENESYRA